MQALGKMLWRDERVRLRGGRWPDRERRGVVMCSGLTQEALVT